MASDALTDYDFWKNYWLSKEGLIFPIPNQYTFTKELADLIKSKKIKTLLEIGGFPGYYSVWAGKKFDVKSTLLDFVILGAWLAKQVCTIGNFDLKEALFKII